jgi:hypothetical protein
MLPPLGALIVPRLLNGHSHVISCLQVLRQANYFARPAGPGESIAGNVAALRGRRDFCRGTVRDNRPFDMATETAAGIEASRDFRAAFPRWNCEWTWVASPAHPR